MITTINEYKNLENSVATFIINSKNEILILQRGSTAPWMPNKWNLPGGIIDKNESKIHTAIRECKEETNLIIDNLVELVSYTDPDFIITFYYTKQFIGDVIIDWESKDYKWVNKKDLLTYDFVPYIKNAIKLL